MADSRDAPLMLSISGLRGIVGASFTAEVAATYARAFAEWILAERATASIVASSAAKDAKNAASAPGALPKPRKGPPLICIARDGRRGGDEALAAVRDSLLACGCDVIDLDVAMTPTVGTAIARHGADGALVVTASHNPQEWNGLKALDADGLAPPPERAAELLSRFRALRGGDRPAPAPPPAKGSLRRDAEAAGNHVALVLKLVDVDAIRRASFAVVLDSVNASGCVAGRMLLERLGCRLTHLNGEPTGVFPHAPEPLEANLRDLSRATAEAHAAVGFAQDPDADRLAIVDERGRYIGEEFTLALAAWRMLERRGPSIMAANLSTSRLIDAVAKRFPGSSVVRTAVGEANVAAALRRDGGVVGGEGNGGVIVPEVTWVRDSLSAMAIVLDLLASRAGGAGVSRGGSTSPASGGAASASGGASLSALVSELPHTVMVKSKLDLAGIGGATAVTPALDRVRTAWPGALVNTADGVRADFADGWVHLRASNTEPIIRIIAEAETAERANELVAQCRAAAGLA